jgi:hypothetical protein
VERGIMDTSKEDINKKVHELLGKCWHEHITVLVKCDYDKSEENYKKCKKCGLLKDYDNAVNKNYPELIADAWELVEFMINKNFEMMFDACEGEYSVSFHETQTGKEMVDIKNNSAPMAICLAFIKVMEEK